jgi:hypothetical protein
LPVATLPAGLSGSGEEEKRRRENKEKRRRKKKRRREDADMWVPPYATSAKPEKN